MRIPREHPLHGELMVDAAGVWFLAPEEDERGEGMGSIPVLGLPEATGFELAGRLVHVSGVYEPGRGLALETIAPAQR